MNETDKVKALVTDMFGQSLAVMTNPSVATFEQFERRGGMTQALIYVTISGVIAGLLSLLSGYGLTGLLVTTITVVVSFFIFVYLVHVIGQNQGGTGKLDEVAYTFALFKAPLNVLGGLITFVVGLLKWIPLLGGLVKFAGGLATFAIFILTIYYGYTAVRSSMNFYNQQDNGKVWITLVGAALVASLGSGIVLGILLG